MIYRQIYNQLVDETYQEVMQKIVDLSFKIYYLKDDPNGREFLAMSDDVETGVKSATVLKLDSYYWPAK